MTEKTAAPAVTGSAVAGSVVSVVSAVGASVGVVSGVGVASDVGVASGVGVGSGVGAGTSVGVGSGISVAVGSGVATGAVVGGGTSVAVSAAAPALSLPPPHPMNTSDTSAMPAMSTAGYRIVEIFTSASVRTPGKGRVSKAPVVLRADDQCRSLASDVVTTFERPAPDLHKITEAWQAWTEAGEAAGGEVLPGRTMADLKIGGTDKVLETLAADNDAVEPAFRVWLEWEDGKTSPETALAGLADNGFTAIVEALDPEQ